MKKQPLLALKKNCSQRAADNTAQIYFFKRHKRSAQAEGSKTKMKKKNRTVPFGMNQNVNRQEKSMVKCLTYLNQFDPIIPLHS